MQISKKDWLAYVRRLSAIHNTAAEKMKAFIERHGVEDMTALVDYAYALTAKYGEASAALSAEMYDAISDLQKAAVDPAEMAETPSYGDVAKTMYGIRKTSVNADQLSGAVGRLVKRTGADTMIKNSIRDRAEFAWIPVGDTCSFCIALASRGWQPASADALKGGHAEHIHANCDCTYMIRFSPDFNVSGYDPQKYLDMYYEADTSSFGYGSVNNDRDVKKPDRQSMSTARINGMRRAQYAKEKDRINEQKRIAYRERKRAEEDGEI
jgi:hypothetical protein